MLLQQMSRNGGKIGTNIEPTQTRSEDIMHDTTRGFETLAPLGEDLKRQQDLEAALKVICPEHENRSGQLIFRLGIDKAGHYRRFETRRGHERSHQWRHDRELSGTEYEAFRLLYESGQLRHENGPHGCFLFFHLHEEVSNVVSISSR